MNGTVYHNGEDNLESKITYFNFGSDEVKVQMDGVSDLSEVIGKLSTYVGNIILRRMTSISNYINGTEKVGKIESFVNRLLG